MLRQERQAGRGVSHSDAGSARTRVAPMMRGQTWAEGNRGVSAAASAMVVVVMAVWLGGCIVTRHPAGIASSSTPLTADYTEIGPVESNSCASWLLGIPLGGTSETAVMIDDLVKEKGADALVGVTVEHTGYVFPLPLFGSSCTTVKGQAVRGGK